MQMNKIIIVILAVFLSLGIFIFLMPHIELFRYGFFGGCTFDLVFCRDGSNPGHRQGIFCRWNPGCPELVYCDKNDQCRDGKKCYKFPGQDKSFCYKGGAYNPYYSKTNDGYESTQCETLETDPVQVVCN